MTSADVVNLARATFLGGQQHRAGMFIGKQLFGRVPGDKFSRVVSAVLLLIGALLVVRLLVMSGKRTSASVSNHEDFDGMEKVSDEQDQAAAVFARVSAQTHKSRGCVETTFAARHASIFARP